MVGLDLNSAADSSRGDWLVPAARALAAWARERESAWDDVPVDPGGAPSTTNGGDELRVVATPPPAAAPRLEPAPEAPPLPAPPVDRPVPVRFGGALFVDADAVEEAGPSRAARLVERARASAPVVARGLAAAVIVIAAIAGGMQGRAYLQRRAAIPKTGVAVLESLPAGSEVAVDGRPLGVTPLTTTLPAGTHAVEFRYRNAAKTVQVTVPVGGRTTELYDWTRKPTGGLQVATTPTGARVVIDGQPRGIAPISVTDLVVGTHNVVLESSEGTVRRAVVIKEGETAQLAETIVAGWVSVFSPFEVAAAEGGRPLALDDRGQVMLPPGTHALTFENREFGYREVRQVVINAGQQTALSLVPPRSRLTVNASEPGEVWVDGTLVGQTPLVDQPIDLGTREVVVKTAAGAERRFTVTVTTKPTTVTADFSH